MLNSAPLCCMFFHQQQYFDWQVCSKPIYPVSWYHPCKLTAVLHETTLELQKKGPNSEIKEADQLKGALPPSAVGVKPSCLVRPLELYLVRI